MCLSSEFKLFKLNSSPKSLIFSLKSLNLELEHFSSSSKLLSITKNSTSDEFKFEIQAFQAELEPKKLDFELEKFEFRA